MSSISSIARSGMTAALSRADAAASNIANQQTPGYQRRQAALTALPAGGVSTGMKRAEPTSADKLVTDVVDQQAASYDFKANLRVLKTADDMLGSLLDTHA